MKKIIIAILSAIIVLLGGGYAITQMGSIGAGQEYNATTTYAYGIKTSQLIKGGYGALGSVIVTGAGNLEYRFYNATTTDAGSGSLKKATSTALLAVIPANLAAGTYVFDVTFTDGLYLDVVSGATGTSTITYR